MVLMPFTGSTLLSTINHFNKFNKFNNCQWTAGQTWMDGGVNGFKFNFQENSFSEISTC